MLRRNVFGLLVDDIGTPTSEELDVLYILECAKYMGMEVIEGKTACSISFCAEIMRRLRESNNVEMGESPTPNFINSMLELIKKEFSPIVGEYTIQEIWEIIDKYKL